MKLSIPEREKLALELARARECAGVSQRRVAREARVHHSLVAHVENCYRPAPPRLLCVMARLCGINSDALLLSWYYVPDDVLMKLRDNPELCEVIRNAA